MNSQMGYSIAILAASPEFLAFLTEGDRYIGIGAACILSSMTVADILDSIDLEIARLLQARALLSGASTTDAASPSRKRRKLSAAARRKIGEAQRKRWAKQKAAK